MRKVISIVLALALVLSMSAVAFAASGSSSGGGGSSTGTTTQTLSDGTTVTTTTTPDGSKTVVSTAKDGSETVDATISAAAANNSTDAKPYTTPAVEAGDSDSDASTIKVTVPSSAKGGSTLVQFAAKNNGAGVVVKEKQADGTYKTVKKAAVGEKGPIVEVKSGKSEYILVDNDLVFNDITEDWMKSGAQFASSRELMVGSGNGKFNPYASIDAATVATVLGRLDDKVTLDQSTGKNWDAAGQSYANANGYKATGDMPRKEMFGEFYKFAGKPAVTQAQKDAVKAAFSDAAELTDEELTQAAWCFANGITQGVGSGRLGFNEPANRGQFTTSLERFVNALVK